MSKATAKHAAILGLVFSGLSVLFLVAMPLAIQWDQERLHPHKDWGMVLSTAFAVLLICCVLAAILSFLVCVFRIVHKRSWGSTQASATEPPISSEPQRKVPHSGIIALVGFAVCIASAHFGPAALFLVGIPVLLISAGIAGGARSPRKIPLSDGILYVGISVAIVIAIAVYALYHH